MGKPLKKAPQRGNRKRGRLTAALIIAAAALLLAFILFTQISEVSDQKGFWDNFQSPQQGYYQKEDGTTAT